jgi:predicted RNA-binding Zn ribbon-like protein
VPTDAATVPLVGGHPALDLVNTVAPREVLPDGSRPVDYLTSPAALLTWSGRAALADPAESELVAQAWQRNPGAGAAALDAVRDLRESLYIALLEAAALVPQHPDIAAAARQRLHDRWVAAAGRSALRSGHDPARPGPAVPGPPRLEIGTAPELQIQDRAAAAAMEFLLTADYERLRRCPPAEGGCGWLVLDLSRNGSRRWCQMADCGSAAKSRRLTERRRVRRGGVTGNGAMDLPSSATGNS